MERDIHISWLIIISPKIVSFQHALAFVCDQQIRETGTYIPMPVPGWPQTCPTHTVIWIYTPQSNSAFLKHDPVDINVTWCPIIFVFHEVITHLPVYIVQCWIVWHIYPNCFWTLAQRNLANAVVTPVLLVTIHSFRSETLRQIYVSYDVMHAIIDCFIQIGDWWIVFKW